MKKKLQLTHMIEKLSGEDLLNIWKILTKYNNNMQGKNEIEVNVNKLPVPALNELYTFVSGRIRSKQQPVPIAPAPQPQMVQTSNAMAIENQINPVTPQKKEIKQSIPTKVDPVAVPNGIDQKPVQNVQPVSQEVTNNGFQSSTKTDMTSGSKINAIQVKIYSFW